MFNFKYWKNVKKSAANNYSNTGEKAGKISENLIGTICLGRILIPTPPSPTLKGGINGANPL